MEYSLFPDEVRETLPPLYSQDGKGDEATVETNHGTLSARQSDIGLEDIVLDAGGLERRLKIFRLPEVMTNREMKATCTIPLKDSGDNPLWISVYTEDGFQAWSSPVFVFN